MAPPVGGSGSRVLLAHGASGTAASMGQYVDGLRRRSIDARAVALPTGLAERAIPAFRAQVAENEVDVVIGGQSYGGRVASMLAADPGDAPIRGLVLLSYPLHRPGHPEELRVGHWPRITCPVLLLSGESDPFARIGLLRQAVLALSSATLVTYPRIGHGLGRVLEDALDSIAAFTGGLPRAR